MTDCILQAIRAYLVYIRAPGRQYPEANEIYYTVRQITGHDPHQYTFIGVVPFIAQSIGNFFGLTTVVEVDPSFTYPALLEMAALWEKAFVMPIVKVGITPGVGIYCGFFGKHAYFNASEDMPKGDLFVMSVKYEKRCK